MSVVRFGMMAGVMLLGACATQPEASSGEGAGAPVPPSAAEAPVEPAADEQKQCNAEAVQTLVGQTHTEALSVDAVKQSGARTLRVIKPGMAVTMDYRIDRLNLELDEAGKVVAARCG
ncbi:MAG TPA: I78 family peptidase inhibitor [Pedomonas sp.]|uniref:I78 family peptidase inhibitor n=1 Tax=Pedomonas sp. TaxID=2976421 RepID=UPI002F40D6EC